MDSGDRHQHALASLSSRFFLRSSPVQSILEALAIAILLSIGVFVSSGDPLGQMYAQALVIGPLCAMYYAARTRLASGGLFLNLHTELAAGLAFVIIVSGLTSAAMMTDIPVEILSTVFFVVFLTVWNAGALAFFRVLSYLWPAWVRLRRSRLRWEMTHTTMMVVAPLLSILILFFVVLATQATGYVTIAGRLTPVEQFMAFLPIVGIMIFVTVVSLGVLLPPAALISYIAARKTAIRLEALSHGTSGLRDGNYAIRVHVDGEDEISSVQQSFNLMAGNLEQTFRDLSEERDNVARLLQTQRELVASVSHELRTPVATMRGYLDAALNGGQATRPADMRADLEIMSGEISRLQRLIDDLFILTRTEAGQLPLHIQPTDTGSVVAACVAATAESAWRTGRVEVIEEIQSGLPLALADPGRLEQVVRNLLSNAVRHTPPGGIVAVSAASSNGSIAIEVKDTGSGIPPEEQAIVFERFYRRDDARRHDPAGAGLGLAIVKDLTEAMGGTVAVRSIPDSGSSFIITLPASTTE